LKKKGKAPAVASAEDIAKKMQTQTRFVENKYVML
jgi:hypothetical protein